MWPSHGSVAEAGHSARLANKSRIRMPLEWFSVVVKKYPDGNDDGMQVFVSYKDLNCVLAKVDSKGALVE